MAARTAKAMEVYIEAGQKRTFACAIDWPGWCRSGRDEASALQALLDYGLRYAEVMRSGRLGFHAPKDVSQFTVAERHKGNTTTDFGAPNRILAGDKEAVSTADLRRFQKVLKAGWQAFDTTVDTAGGKSLRKGPRGGGRELETMIQHLLGSDVSYVGALGWKFKPDDKADLSEQLGQTRQAILDALAAGAQGEIPARGPKGGERWPLRYFVRRLTWHLFDHIWEIEDRST